MKRSIIFILLIIITFTLFASCGNAQLKKSATYYGDANEYVTDSAKETYKTGGVSPDFKDLPKEHTILIKTQEEFDQILKDSSIECDFEQEMLVVHTFTTIAGVNQNSELKRIRLKGNKLIIKCRMERLKGYYNASIPWQKWVVIKMKKVDVESVEVQFA